MLGVRISLPVIANFESITVLVFIFRGFTQNIVHVPLLENMSYVTVGDVLCTHLCLGVLKKTLKGEEESRYIFFDIFNCAPRWRNLKR